MSENEKIYKKFLRRKEKKNTPTIPFPDKWKKKLAKFDKVSYCNQGKWINERKYGKG